MSACGRQADEGIIAHRGDCLKCHVAGSIDGPFIVLLEQQRSVPAHDGFIVGKDGDDLCARLDLAVQALDRVGRVDLGKGHVGEHILLGGVLQVGSNQPDHRWL